MKMKYRELGNTGMQVSVIGLGLENVDFKPYEQVKGTVDVALEHGVNIFDLFMPGTEIRENFAKALGNKREKVMIQGHFGSTNVSKQYEINREITIVIKYFDELLRIFGYIDFGMMFLIDTEEEYNKVFDSPFVKYVELKKKQGDIHHIGFSSHSPDIAMKIVNTDIPEMMMFSINPAFDMLPFEEHIFKHIDSGFGADMFRGIDPKREELYRLCTQKGVGITVMKAFGGGRLLTPGQSPYAKPLTTSQCIHYALSKPSVASIMAGCQNADEMRDTLLYLEASDAEKDYTEILNSVQNDFRGSCVYCSHCQPCPSEIDIAAVNKYLDIALLDKSNVPPTLRAHYKSLEHKGGECIACGSCEKRCPFGVSIIEKMKEAEMLLN